MIGYNYCGGIGRNKCLVHKMNLYILRLFKTIIIANSKY